MGIEPEAGGGGGGRVTLPPEAAASLLARAKEVRDRAYAPYSGFGVGAALLDGSGGVHPGVNIENASLSLTVCAERSAVSCAVTTGAASFVAIAVAGPNDGTACMPCGSCRQVLWELAPELLVILDDPAGLRQIPLRDLLPSAFGPDSLGR